MALANTLVRDQRWMRILSKLQPKLANFTKSRAVRLLAIASLKQISGLEGSACICSSWCVHPGVSQVSTTPAQVIFCGPILCLQDDSPERVMMLLQSSPVLSAYGYITSGATLLSVPEGLSIANASLQHRLVDLEITMDHEQAYPHTQPAHPPLSTIDRHLSRVRPPCPTFHQ